MSDVWKRRVLVTSGFGLFVASFGGYCSDTWIMPSHWTLRILCFLASIVLMIWSIRITEPEPPIINDEPELRDEPETQNVDFAVGRDRQLLHSQTLDSVEHALAEVDKGLGASFGSDQAAAFTFALLFQRRSRLRLMEEGTPELQTIAYRISVLAKLPDFAGKSVPFPVLIAPKASQIDNLRVFERDGRNPLRLYTHPEYLELVAVSLRRLLVKAYDNTDDLPPEALAAEKNALVGIAYPHPYEHDQELTGTQDTSVADWAVASMENLDVIDPTYQRAAIALTTRLAKNYAIAAHVASDDAGYLEIVYEYTAILRQGRKGERIETYLGARKFVIEMSLGLAPRCQSYHLQIFGPQGAYLAFQEPGGWSPEQVPYIKQQAPSGQANGHFYARDFPELPETSNPRVLYEYFETPPGSSFHAAIAAIAAFVLIAVIGWSSAHGAGTTPTAAILLTFPAFAAAWLGTEAPAGGLLPSTREAKLSLISTASLSVWAIALLAAHGVFLGASWCWFKLPWHMSILGISETWWAIIVLFAILNAWLMSYQALVRFKLYFSLLGR